MNAESLVSMEDSKCIPRIGVGVLIWNDDKILLGLRIGEHGKNTWSPPGGYLEFGESFEECAIREVKEETSIILKSVNYFGLTNNVFNDEHKHTVSIFMKASFPQNQNIINKEPDHIKIWDWFNIDNMPNNLFLPLIHLIKSNGLNL